MANSTNLEQSQAIRFPYLKYDFTVTQNLLQENYSDNPQIATMQKVARYSIVGLVAIAAFESLKNCIILLANAAIALANMGYDFYNANFSDRKIEVLNQAQSMDIDPSASSSSSSSSSLSNIPDFDVDDDVLDYMKDDFNSAVIASPVAQPIAQPQAPVASEIAPVQLEQPVVANAPVADEDVANLAPDQNNAVEQEQTAPVVIDLPAAPVAAEELNEVEALAPVVNPVVIQVPSAPVAEELNEVVELAPVVNQQAPSAPVAEEVEALAPVVNQHAPSAPDAEESDEESVAPVADQSVASAPDAEESDEEDDVNPIAVNKREDLTISDNDEVSDTEEDTINEPIDSRFEIDVPNSIADRILNQAPQKSSYAFYNPMRAWNWFRKSA